MSPETMVRLRPTVRDRLAPARPGLAPKPTGIRAAYVLSAVAAVLMAASSVVGLAIGGLYPDGAWAREAFRGGDLVTLVIAVPLLIGALALSMRGVVRAQPIWIGVLMYAVYNYAFYVFGARFSDAFLLHIAILSTSIFALICGLSSMDLAGVARRYRTGTMTRVVGGFLMLVGVAQGAAWIFLLLRFALTGELLHDIPVAGQHVVFALDLTLLVPTLALAGILLFRAAALGLILGLAVSVMGAVYQLNLLVAGVFQARADVAGVTAFASESLAVTSAFVAATVVLLLARPSHSSDEPRMVARWSA